MPELRKDPITERWVIIASERGKRPSDFKVPHDEVKAGFCPFCEGNENATPPEVVAIRPGSTPPNTPGWSLRVVPNKFPALNMETTTPQRIDDLYTIIPGMGYHEVIIETPRHSLNSVELSNNEMKEVMRACQQRIHHFKNDPLLKYVMVFKNQGSIAGASLQHTHTQLIALPIVPKAINEEMRGSQRYFDTHQKCIYCEIIRRELENRERFVMENDYGIVFCPIAPRFPFETWILPKRHYSHFEMTSEKDLEGMAQLIKDFLVKQDRSLDSPPYNIKLHTAPLTTGASPVYHWHIKVIPRLTTMAGFEHGTGFYINPTSPELAATTLSAA